MVTSDINIVCSKLNPSFSHNPSPRIQLIDSQIFTLLLVIYLTLVEEWGEQGDIYLSIYTHMHILIYLIGCPFKTTILISGNNKTKEGEENNKMKEQFQEL